MSAPSTAFDPDAYLANTSGDFNPDAYLADQSTSSFQEAEAVLNSGASLGRKAWEGLAVPAQMSRRGLTFIANAVPNPEPTGNVPLDLLRGTPRVAAEVMAEAAPGFINRASLLVGGAANVAKGVAPLAKAMGRGIGSQMESLTGAVPGSLKAAWNDASLIFSKGKEAAKPFYEAGKAESQGTNIFKGMYKPDKIIDTAQEYLSKGGKLEPAEALMYRKAIDSAAKSGRYVKDELYAMRQEADAMAKASDNISEADQIFQRGRQAQSLRNVLPQNKYGGTSAFKLAIMTALEQMGITGKAIMVGMSPVVSGGVATAVGLASRTAIAPIVTNPAASVTLRNVLETYNERKWQAANGR